MLNFVITPCWEGMSESQLFLVPVSQVRDGEALGGMFRGVGRHVGQQSSMSPASTEQKHSI